MESKNTQPSSQSFNTTNNISVAIEDAQFLLEYVAENGISIDEKELSTLVDSKFLYKEGKWNSELEHKFWRSTVNITNEIKPVTIQSIRAVKPTHRKGKLLPSEADKSVSRYRTLAVVSLVILLVIQIYLIIGVTAKSKAHELFIEKEAKIQEILSVRDCKESNNDIESLQLQYKESEQKQDANYALLKSWNKVWLTLLFKDEYEGKVRPYRQAEYKAKHGDIEAHLVLLEETLKSNTEQAEQESIRKQIADLKEKLQKSQLQREHDTTRNEFFLNTFSSEYAITAIERYVLPLLYGLLGAVFFVLRTLSNEVQNQTYIPNAEINYRLRIPTGALAGLTISWFIVDPNPQAEFSISGFAISFLTGYNVEILFSLMDKAIAQLTNKSPNSKNVES